MPQDMVPRQAEGCLRYPRLRRLRQHARHAASARRGEVVE